MKKLGFEFKPLRKSPFLREEKPAAREETRPQEQKPAAEQPYIPKSDGIYIIKYHESKTEEVLVSYNGVEFTMPLLRKGASRATTKASDCTLGSDIECVSKTSSHRIGERGSLTMVGLAALLEKAERAKADIITFSLTGRDRLSGDKIGAYNFFRYTGEPDSKPFKGYDVESLREKLEKAKLKTTAPISQ